MPEALASLRRLIGTALSRPLPSWLAEAERLWSQPGTLAGRAAVAIWRDPWMAVGRDTFTGDVVRRLGLTHVLAGDTDRYPHVALADLDDPGRVDLVLLPDEPYAFTATDGPERFCTPVRPAERQTARAWSAPSLVGAQGRPASAVRA